MDSDFLTDPGIASSANGVNKVLGRHSSPKLASCIWENKIFTIPDGLPNGFGGCEVCSARARTRRMLVTADSWHPADTRSDPCEEPGARDTRLVSWRTFTTIYSVYHSTPRRVYFTLLHAWELCSWCWWLSISCYENTEKKIFSRGAKTIVIIKNQTFNHFTRILALLY